MSSHPIKALSLDLSGALYNGGPLIDGAQEAVREARRERYGPTCKSGSCALLSAPSNLREDLDDCAAPGQHRTTVEKRYTLQEDRPKYIPYDTVL